MNSRGEMSDAPEPPPAPSRASQEKPQPTERTERREAFRLFLGMFARGFPLAKTIAPEARFGLLFSRWKIALGGYAMGWSSSLGSAYLAAFTLTGGPVLWQYDGKVSAHLELSTELGAVIAFGKPKQDVTYTPKFNVAAGAHLAFRLGPGSKKRFRPELTLECGWLRGLSAFAGDTFQGGFEGLSAAAGIVANW